jgi:asparagine synthase (glutamine-hydrolysing)
MCGIAGEVDLRAQPDHDRVRAMRAGLDHRGPDADGWYASPDGAAAFGFRRLSIVDLSTGDQPIANEDGSVVSMFNGEIYNHRDLRERLIGLGHQFRTDHADSEVVVHGYEAWGDDLVRELRGMFAIAVWDVRARRLLLARDRLGEKPLYYRLEGHGLRFASEIGALEAPGDDVDPAALALYLTYQYIPAPVTILKGVRKLEPGQRLTFGADGLHLERYWTVRSAVPERRSTPDGVKALIDESVRIRCAADVPVGAFLSGGVDSSVVTALLARVSPDPVHTFSIGFPDARLDETPAAQRVADALGTQHHVLRMDELDPIVVEHAIASAGEPLADAAAIPTYLLAEEASRWVKVVLTGEGADELFGGYARYRYQHRLRPLLHAPLPLRRLAARGLRRLSASPLEARVPARLADLLDTPVRAQAREWRAVMPIDLRRRLVPGMPAIADDPVLAMAGRSADPISDSFATDLATWVPEDLLVKVDRTTMAWGLEARPPFLDHRLVQAVLSLPTSERWQPGRDKALLRDFAAGLVPAQTAARPKQPFLTPTRAWLSGPLASSYRVAREALIDTGIDSGALRSLEARSLGRGRDGGQWAWVMYVLGRWLATRPAGRRTSLAA